MSRQHLRIAVLVVAAVEFAPAAWLIAVIALGVINWSAPHVYELFWIPGLLGAPSLLALLLALSGRGLGWAAGLCIVYALIGLFFLAIAQVATVAGQMVRRRTGRGKVGEAPMPTEEIDDYPPPWLAGIGPDDPATQGLAEAVIALNRLPFWQTLSPGEKAAYLDRWRASDEWRSVIAMRYDVDPAELEQDAIAAAEWRAAREARPPRRAWWRFWR